MTYLEKGWSQSRLEKLTSLIKDGSHGTHDDVPDGVPLLSAKDVRDGTIEIPDNCRQISEADYTSIHKNYTINQNDILLTIVGSIGRCYLMTGTEQRFSIQRSVAVIRPDTIVPAYLYHFLRSEEFQKELKDLTNASAQGGVYLASLAQCLTRFPLSKLEQAAIADILSTVDRAIAQTEALIAKQQRIKTGLMQDLLTRGINEHGKLRSEKNHQFKDSPLGRIPVEWKCVTTAEVARSLVPGRDKPALDGGGIPWITIPDIEGIYIRAAKTGLSLSHTAIKAAHARLMPEGTLLMSCVGEFGISTIAEVDVVANQQLHGFICDKAILPEWLAIQISASSIRIEQMATQTTIKYLNKKGCESILIALPEIDEQERSVDLLRSVLQRLSHEQKHLVKLLSLKTALMQDLLMGKTNVNALLKDMEDIGLC